MFFKRIEFFFHLVRRTLQLIGSLLFVFCFNPHILISKLFAFCYKLISKFICFFFQSCGGKLQRYCFSLHSNQGDFQIQFKIKQKFLIQRFHKFPEKGQTFNEEMGIENDNWDCICWWYDVWIQSIR